MTQNIREEWLECWQGDKKDMPPIMEKCADWWIDKLNTTLKEIEEEVEKMRPHSCDCSGAKYECEHWGRHEIIDDIKQLIHQKLIK